MLDIKGKSSASCDCGKCLGIRHSEIEASAKAVWHHVALPGLVFSAQLNIIHIHKYKFNRSRSSQAVAGKLKVIVTFGEFGMGIESVCSTENEVKLKVTHESEVRLIKSGVTMSKIEAIMNACVGNKTVL